MDYSMLPYTRARDVDPFWPSTSFGTDPFLSMQPYGFGAGPLSTTFNSLEPLVESQRRMMRAYNPILSADLVERADGTYAVHADLPGVDPADLDITVDNDTLNIKAERSQVSSQDTDTWWSQERKFGQVRRTLRLPPNCDADKADVRFKNGVLEITFPKKTGVAARKKLAIKE